jgi:hypothetical protein
MFCVNVRLNGQLFNALQGCQIFLDIINQTGEKYTKLPKNYQMTVNKPKIHNMYIQNGHKIYQRIGIFGLKIFHLATLMPA